MVLDSACTADRPDVTQPKFWNNSRKNAPQQASSLDNHEDDDDASLIENLIGAAALAAAGIGTYFYFNQKSPSTDNTHAGENKVDVETLEEKKDEIDITSPNIDEKKEIDITSPNIDEKKVDQELKKLSENEDAKLLALDRFHEAVGFCFELKRLSSTKLNELFTSATTQLLEGKSVNECFRNAHFICFFQKLATVNIEEAQKLCTQLFQTAKDTPDNGFYRDFFFTYNLCALPKLLQYMVHPSQGLNVNGFGPRGNTCLHHMYSLLKNDLKEDEKKAIWEKINCLVSCRADPFLENANQVAVADRVRHQCEQPTEYEWLLKDEDFKKFDNSLRESCLKVQKYIKHGENTYTWGTSTDFNNIVGYSKSSATRRPAVVTYALKYLENELLDEKKNLQHVTRALTSVLIKEIELPTVLCEIIAGYCGDEEERFLPLQHLKNKMHYEITKKEEDLYLLTGLIEDNVDHKQLALLPRSVAKSNITRVDILLALGANTWLQYDKGLYALDVVSFGGQSSENSRIIWAKIADKMITQRIVGLDQKTIDSTMFTDRRHEMESRLFSYLLNTYRRCSLEGLFKSDKDRACEDHNCQGRETHKPVLLAYIQALKDSSAHFRQYYYTQAGVRQGLIFEYMFMHDFPVDVVKAVIDGKYDPNFQHNGDTFMHRLAFFPHAIAAQKNSAERLKEYINICQPNLSSQNSKCQTVLVRWNTELKRLKDKSQDDATLKQIRDFNACIQVIEAAAKMQIEAGSK